MSLIQLPGKSAAGSGNGGGVSHGIHDVRLGAAQNPGACRWGTDCAEKIPLADMRRVIDRRNRRSFHFGVGR